VIDAAEEFNDPGTFTTLIGFEWTSLVSGSNLHRNVIFRDGPDRVRQLVPYTTQPPVGSTDPLDVYDYLENCERRTNGAVLATAHNGNLPNGLMFQVDAQYTGRAIDEEYGRQRAKWEPVYKITQIKGDGEAHPMLSRDDAFADFGTWDVGNLALSGAKTPDRLRYEYAREALKNGPLLEERFGANPDKFGHQGLQGGLISGFTHPLFGWDHVVAMVAVGLWGAFLGRPAIWILPVVFPVVMAIGGALGVRGVPLPAVEAGIALSGVILGLMVARAVKAPLWVAAVIVGVFAVVHGHAHGTELPSAADPIASAVGFLVATGLLHLAGIAFALLIARPSGTYAVRGAGAVIAAVGAAFLTGAA